ncbi:MAG: peptidoglycan DD-metalloendopeptidase family protein [Roseobacter sp.]
MFAVLKGLILALLMWLPMAVSAATADRAREAAALLDAATADLNAARGARDRVRALTKTITAFEKGLTALRSGLRMASSREIELIAELHAKDAEIATLLAVMMRAGDSVSPVALLHPGGAIGAARAGMMLSEVTPVFNEKAERLRSELSELRQLRQVQETSAERLEVGLKEVQIARAALNTAIADREELPKKFVADPVREAILLSSTQTLGSFAAGLDQISAGITPAAPLAMEQAKGTLALPVTGHILRGAGEADAAGIARPGIILATEPKALVTSPVGATLRYVGPLLDFGQVIILEPEANVLFVFAGLETIYAETGEVVEAGAPLGLMGDAGQKNTNAASTDGDEGGTERSETLYIEVRDNNRTENPTLWFRTEQNG